MLRLDLAIAGLMLLSSVTIAEAEELEKIRQ